MQSVSSRIWTRVGVSISYDDNHYTTGTSLLSLETLYRRSLSMKFFIWPINSGVLTSLLHPHLSLSLTDFLPSLNLLCHSKTHARFLQDAPKAAWSIPYVSVAFFPSLKLNFMSYRSSKVSSRQDCIFDNQALVGCIPIAAVAVLSNLKS